MSGGSLDTNRIDDEHRLIARYAARLAADANHAVSTNSTKYIALSSSTCIYASLLFLPTVDLKWNNP